MKNTKYLKEIIFIILIILSSAAFLYLLIIKPKFLIDSLDWLVNIVKKNELK